MKRFTAADVQSHAVVPHTSDVKTLEQGAIAEKRRAFVQDWLANRGRSISLLSAGGLIFLPLLGATSAQAQQGPVLVSTLDGVSSMAFNPDGSLQLALSNGQFVTIAAAEVTVMANGAIAISAAAAELVASLAGIGAAGLGTGALAALGGGVAAAAAAAGGGGGDSDAGSSSSSSPPPPVRDASFASNPDSPLAVNGGMVLSAQNFVGIAPADSIVQITLNDANGDPLLDGAGDPYVFQGTALPDGTYSISLPAFNTLVPGDGDYQLVIQAFNDDGTGNPTGNPRGTQTVEITVDTAPPTLVSIDTPIAANGEINIADSQNDLVITGTSSGAEDGAEVVVTLNGVAHSGTVTADAWSVTVPASAVQDLPDGTVAISVEVFDLARNSDTGSVNVDVDLTPPTISITALPFGDFLNLGDTGATQTINGTSVGANGRTVTLTVTDFAEVTSTFSELTDAVTGAWSIDLPIITLQALAEGAATLSATVTDSFNNPPASPATAPFTVDTIAPDVTITQIAGDDTINIPEQAGGFTVSGTTDASEDGRTVTVTITGVTGGTGTGTVQPDGSWTADMPAGLALTNGSSPEFTASVTDAANNTGTSAPVTANVNLTEPTITFNTLAGDDILNIAESNAAELTISGTTTGFADNDQITLSANGIDDITLTVTGNAFTHYIAREDVFALIVAATGAAPDLDGSGNLISAGAGNITFTASGTNNIGNPSGNVTTDLALALTPPALAIGDIEGTGGIDLDGVINIDERAAGLEINGTSDAEGQTVTVTLTDGAGFTASATGTVTGGTWQANFAAGSLNGVPDGTTEISLTAEVTDANGNGTTTAPTTMPTDFIAPVVTIASVESGGEAIGDFINIDERDAGITVSGGTDLPENTTVTVTVTAGAFTATATGTTDVNGDWSAVFAGDTGAYVLENLPEGAVSIVASADDAAGNTGESTPETPTADLTPPVILINAIGDEGVYDRSQGPLTLTGTTDAEAGQVVTVTFEGQTYTGTVTAGGGSGSAPNTWALDDPIPSSALNALAPGTAFVASATVSDLAGNAAVTPATVDVVPYSASDSYITEVSRNGNDIRFGIFVEIDSPLLTDAAYALGDTMIFDTTGLQYLSPVEALPLPQPGYDNTFVTLALSNTDFSELANGRVEFAGVWVEDTTFGTIAVPNPEVARVAFTLRDLNAGSEVITLSLENDQGLVATTFIGTNGDDTLTATNTDSLIRGGGGNDTIDMSAGGVNTVIFEADPSANGLDTITGFSSLNTALPDRIGFAGLDNATLRGDGTDFQALGSGGTLGADTGFVVLTFDLGGLTAVDLATAAAGLDGEGAGDIIYLLATDGTNAALARVTYTDVNDASAEIMANFTGLGDLSGITANEILGFNTV